MSANRPSLDDLIRAQRGGVGMTPAQRAANRARLTSRVLAQSVATAAAGVAASTAGIGSASASAGATAWLAKTALGLALMGGVGAAYLQANAPAPADSASRRTQPRQTPPVQPVRAAPAAVPVPNESAAPTPASSAAPVPATRAPKGPSTAMSATSTSSASLAVEVQLMRDIDSALKSGHPDRALALLAERREGDGGYMQEERAAAGIFALCQLGRVESARSAAERFVRDRPRSPLAARVKATCAASAAAGTKGKLP